MDIRDRVYGTIEISEPILLDLINSPTLQRLKNIDQAGYFEPYFPGTQHSRFEHSLGACLLLKKYGAPIEEQIAGLIHDVSHSAFSHCIDYVLRADLAEENKHQDDIFDAYIRKTDIPLLLKKHGFDTEYILNDKNFPLKEKELPDLCADRIDYSLRAACVFGEITNANYFLENLMVENGDWIFKTFESAKRYAELFHKLNTGYWAGLSSAVMFQTVSDYLRYALSKGYISEFDLYTTDQLVLSKVSQHHTSDEQLAVLFERMNARIGYKNNPDDFESEVYCKSRAIDPLCDYQGKTKRVSQIDTNWADVIKKESKPKHYFIKFER